MTLYRLSGARIKVGLSPAALDDIGTLRHAKRPSQIVDTTSKVFAGAPGRSIQLDLAEISIINKGRAAAFISEVQLDLGPERMFRRRYYVAGQPIPLRGAVTEERFRLEPGEAVTIYMDIWAFLPASIKQHRPTRSSTHVRASVRTNMGRRKRSPIWLRWSVSPGQENFEDTPITFDAVVWRSLFRWLVVRGQDEDSTMQDRYGRADMARMLLRDELQQRPVEPTRLADKLKQIVDPLLASNAGFNLAWALKDFDPMTAARSAPPAQAE